MAEEKLEKEHFEILLEGIKSDVKLVLEGHAVLNNKIDEVKKDVKFQINVLDTSIRAAHYDIKILDTSLSAARDDIKEIGRKLDVHINVPHAA